MNVIKVTAAQAGGEREKSQKKLEFNEDTTNTSNLLDAKKTHTHIHLSVVSLSLLN